MLSSSHLSKEVNFVAWASWAALALLQNLANFCEFHHVYCLPPPIFGFLLLWFSNALSLPFIIQVAVIYEAFNSVGLNENSGVCYVLCVSNETWVCVCVCRRVLPEWKPQRWLPVGNWFCSQLLMGTSQSNKVYSKSLQRGAHTGKQGRKIIWECLV